jgi:chromate reductase
MSDKIRILAIPGSLRADSHNRRLLEAARRQAAGEGVEVEILDSDRLRALPHFDEDIEHDPGAAVEAFREAIAAADALLIATPEYNSSIPGVLKNAIDWASRPRDDAALQDKPAAVVGASPARFGAAWAQAELRKVLGAAGARVLEGELALGTAHEAFDGAGGLADRAHVETLEALIGELAGERELALAA